MVVYDSNRIINCLTVCGLALLVSSCAAFDRNDRRAAVPATEAATPREAPLAGTRPGVTFAESGTEAPGPTLLPGTDQFVNLPDPSAKQVTEIAGDIILNFQRTNVVDFLRVVLGGILKQNFTVDPGIKGTVTVQTSRPIPRASVLSVVETILRLNGFAIVRDRDFYRVVQLADAVRGAPLRTGPLSADGAGFGIRIVPPRFVAAAELQKVLKPMTPKGADIRVDEARNLLIISGTSPDIRRLMEAVDIFDVDWLAGMSFGMFPVQFTDAVTIAEELTKVFGEAGESPLAGIIRFVPIERMNAVMVITQRAEYLQRAEEWIGRLDRSVDKTGRRIYIYRVQSARAEKLAPLLTEIFGGRKAAAAKPGNVTPDRAPFDAPKAERDSSTRASAETQSPATGAPPTSDRESARGPKTPEAVQAPVGIAIPSNDGGSISSAQAADFKVIADDDHNSLLIMATPAEYQDVIGALRKLDVIPLQVLVKATILEVKLTDALQYGIEWFFESKRRVGELAMHRAALSLAGGVPAAAAGFSYLFTNGRQSGVINALSEVTDVKVLSSPQILVLDNQTATLQVGDQVSVPTRTSVSTDAGNAPIVTENQFRDTGVILRVTPRVNPGGLVIMEVEQEVSNLTALDPPIIAQRRISTTIAVHSGDSVAMGGLIQESKNEDQSGIPLLMDIPFFGALFRTTTKNVVRTELLVILTPQVVGNRADARAVSMELRERMEGISRWFPRESSFAPIGDGKQAR